MSIGIGILGTAHGHVGMYCGQWAKQPDRVRLLSVWDHDCARGEALAGKFGAASAASVEALLATPGLDAVVIGVETSMHAELVEQAARAGKRIVLQKPIATTLADADRIVAAIAAHRVPFTLAWQMRVDPQNLRMKQLVQEGTLGRIYMLRRRHGLSTHTWVGFEKTWHVDPVLNRGMWADDACHAIDFIYWMLGMPRSVSAEIGTLRSPAVPDDHGIAVYRYADGTMAEVASSFTCLAGENTTEIVGENGVVIQNYGDLVSCNAPRAAAAVGLKWMLREKPEWIDSGIASPDNHGRRIEGLSGPLLEFLEGRRAPIATADEGRDVMRLVLASYQSSEWGRRIDI